MQESSAPHLAVEHLADTPDHLAFEYLTDTLDQLAVEHLCTGWPTESNPLQLSQDRGTGH